MTYGGVDRGGSRESKKASLRKNKKAINEAAKLAGKGPAQERPTASLKPPRLLASGHDCAIDCGAQLLNRQFDRDQLKVLNRSVQAGNGGSPTTSAAAYGGHLLHSGGISLVVLPLHI